jgi:N-acetylglucosamine kinase-like BadF-type ATPase
LSADGRTILRAESGSASPTANGQPQALLALRELLEPVRNAADARVFDAVCVGSAGGEAPSTREFLAHELTATLNIDRLSIVSDADLVIPAAGLHDGVAVISGTGSVAIGSLGRRRIQLGGWGYRLGDEGSGYWVVREAVRAVLARGGSDSSRLETALCAGFGVRDRRQLLQRLYELPGPNGWAHRAANVYGAAAEGDADAAAVISRAAESLSDLALTALAKLDEKLPVVLAGGMLTSQPVLAAMVGRKLADYGHHATSVLAEPPVVGAVLLAERMAEAPAH